MEKPIYHWSDEKKRPKRGGWIPLTKVHPLMFSDHGHLKPSMRGYSRTEVDYFVRYDRAYLAEKFKYDLYALRFLPKELVLDFIGNILDQLHEQVQEEGDHENSN